MDAVPVSDLLQALADPTRLRILSLLRRMELSVGELAQLLGQSQPRVSRHVRILTDAGAIERRREGSWVFLTIAGQERTAPMFALLDAWLDERSAAVFERDAARLEGVRADRAEAASRYFAARAETWDSIRSLHVAEAEVEEAIARTIGDRPLGRLADVGTGTGRMLELFGPHASEAIGIDRSSEMLRIARAKLQAAGIAASLRQGDMYVLPLEDGSADTIIIHQVLHYAHSPAAAICEATRVLDRGGQLLVVDFAAHDREELRATDAHIRLGFDDETMAGWFSAAGLSVDHVEHLEGGELTVTLWRGLKAGARQRERRAA